MPESRGRRWNQSSRRGGRGPSASSSCRGPTPAPRPEPSTEATREAAKRGRLRSKTRAFIGSSRRPGAGSPRPGRPGWSGPVRSEPRRSTGPRGRRGCGTAVGLGPVLDVPAPPPGDGGQLGLGVDGHRKAHRLQHGQVAGRVGVGHRLLELEPLGLGVVARTRARASPMGGSSSSRPVNLPSASPSRAQTMSSNSGRRGSTTRSRAPVIRMVRCPRARCWRTRAMPAGNDLANSRSEKSSHPSSRSRSTGAPS